MGDAEDRERPSAPGRMASHATRSSSDLSGEDGQRGASRSLPQTADLSVPAASGSTNAVSGPNYLRPKTMAATTSHPLQPPSPPSQTLPFFSAAGDSSSVGKSMSWEHVPAPARSPRQHQVSRTELSAGAEESGSWGESLATGFGSLGTAFKKVMPTMRS